MRGMYVCMCHGITDRDIRHEVETGAHSFDELQARTGCSDCCGCCGEEAREIFATALASPRPAATQGFPLPLLAA